MQFNLLSFTLPTDTITVNLYSEKVEKTHPNIVYRDECTDLWEQNPDKLAESKYLYCSFANEETECKGDKYTVTINLNNALRVAIHYIRHLIFDYFRGRVPAVCYNFVDGVEIWIKAEQQQNITKFNKFTLNLQYIRTRYAAGGDFRTGAGR